MLLSANNNYISESLDRADKWMRNQATRSLRILDTSSPSKFVRSVKAITEIIYWYTHVSPNLNSESIRTTLYFLSKIDLCTYLSLFRSNPELSPLFFALFSSLDHQWNDQQRQDIKSVSLAMRSTKRERSFFRALDRIHGISKFDRAICSDITNVDLDKFSCLPNIGDMFSLDGLDSYAFTHTIFYVTDFGAKQLPHDDLYLDFITFYILTMMSLSLSNDDIDLFCEFALCLLFIGRGSYISDCHVNFIISHQNEYGAWAPIDAVVKAVEGDGFCGMDVEFYSNYHPTLLARDVLARYLCASSSNKKYFDLSINNCDYNLCVKLFMAMSINDVASTYIVASEIRPNTWIFEALNTFYISNISSYGFGFANPDSINRERDHKLLNALGNKIGEILMNWKIELNI